MQNAECLHECARVRELTAKLEDAERRLKLSLSNLEETKTMVENVTRDLNTKFAEMNSNYDRACARFETVHTLAKELGDKLACLHLLVRTWYFNGSISKDELDEAEEKQTNG